MPFFFVNSVDQESGTPGKAATLLAGVLNSALDAIISVDAQQRIVLYNQAAEQMFGWLRQDILLQPLECLIPDGFGQADAQHGDTGAAFQRAGMRRMVCGRHRNGDELLLEASVSRLDTPEGMLLTGTLRDATDINPAQCVKDAPLHESQRQLPAAPPETRIACWQLDLATQQMQWSEEAHTVLGLERPLLGGTYGELVQRIHPGDRQAFETRRSAALQSGAALDIELRVIASSSEVRWIHLLGWPQGTGEDKKALCCTGVIREITQRKHSDQAMARHASLLALTGALAKAGAWELDVETMTPYYSDEVYRLHALDPSASAALRNPLSFYPPEAKPVIRAAIKAALEHARPWNLELPFITAKGQQIWVRTQGRADMHNGKVVRLSGVLQDITEIKAIEATLHLSHQEFNTFSHSVSHDLRAPLNIINGFSHLLAKKLKDHANQDVQHYLVRLQAGATQIGKRIEHLLTLSRVSRVLVRSEAVDLSMMAHGILASWQAREPGRQVAVHIESGLQAHGDAQLVRMALENLLANAWKFSSQTAHAAISVGQTAVSCGATPVFFVHDNGAGFDMAYADKLFKPFQRLHEVCDFPGTGMGLAIASRAIGRHGGRLWAESAPGCGARFLLTLPAAPEGENH